MPKIKTVRGTENRKVVSQRRWLAARKKLLAKEKKFSKLRDELNLQRRKLPSLQREQSAGSLQVSIGGRNLGFGRLESNAQSLFLNLEHRIRMV